MRPKILALDDSKVVRIIAQNVLNAFDCDVSEATNGYNALFTMERSLPDFILLDVSMPVMGGVKMLTLLKSKPELQAIPVIHAYLAHRSRRHPPNQSSGGERHPDEALYRKFSSRKNPQRPRSKRKIDLLSSTLPFS
jgi:CheY-like chemotaxis protein